jgi:hypothetical protein
MGKVTKNDLTPLIASIDPAGRRITPNSGSECGLKLVGLGVHGGEGESLRTPVRSAD